ncbi:hypothetical protein [Falsiroseomonas selenitidurans]|uniref:Uncharacterized protein n=1 Tax=Falsiroseomonas selenitidurans TaxID=2716335 RepID=A0ABX1E337_9PROT|nr:hypothetical protein [Falsiroseomonas selenitidurans]NKC31584.1 hypothetical protein [Falsiroseomonas selenitidurans]
MTRNNRIVPALAAAALLSFAVPALADGYSYPRVVGTGENASIDYGDAPLQNVVGGGAVSYTVSARGTWSIRHLEDRFAQPARPGQVPVTIGSGESTTTVWVPSGTDTTTVALFNGFNGG